MSGASARVIDGIEQRKQLARAIAVPEQRKCQRRPHRRVGVLPAILAQTRRVGLDIARIVCGAVEGRREQLHQPVAAADQLRVDRRHRAQRALAGSRGAGYHGPGLSDGVDAALIARDRSQRGAVVEIAAPVPIPVPGFALDGLLQGEGMLAPQRRLGRRRRADSASGANLSSVACRNHPSQTLSPRPAAPTRFMPSFQSPAPNSGRPCEPMARARIERAHAMLVQRRGIRRGLRSRKTCSCCSAASGPPSRNAHALIEHGEILR